MAEINIENELPIERDASGLEEILQAEDKAEQAKHQSSNPSNSSLSASQDPKTAGTLII